jgi:hypothetical protein
MDAMFLGQRNHVKLRNWTLRRAPHCHDMQQGKEPRREQQAR